MVDLAPNLLSALQRATGSGATPLLGVLGGLSRAAAGATGLPLTFQRGVGPLQGPAAQLFRTPADGAARARQSFEPAAGADMATIERVHRRRVAEHRNAAFDGLGLAYHGTAAAQTGGDRLRQPADGVANAATERAQKAAVGVALVAVLEELQLTSRLLAARTRVQAADTLRREDLGPEHRSLQDDGP